MDIMSTLFLHSICWTVLKCPPVGAPGQSFEMKKNHCRTPGCINILEVWIFVYNTVTLLVTVYSIQPNLYPIQPTRDAHCWQQASLSQLSPACGIRHCIGSHCYGTRSISQRLVGVLVKPNSVFFQPFLFAIHRCHQTAQVQEIKSCARLMAKRTTLL